jgi:hypothetical protein
MRTWDMWQEEDFRQRVLTIVATEDPAALLPFDRPSKPYQLPHTEIVPDQGVPRRMIVVGHYCDRGGDRVRFEGQPLWKAAKQQLTRLGEEGHFEVAAFIEPVLGEGPDPTYQAAQDITRLAMERQCGAVMLVSNGWIEAQMIRPLLKLLPGWVRLIGWARDNYKNASLVGMGLDAQTVVASPSTVPYPSIYGELSGPKLRYLKAFLTAANAAYAKKRTWWMSYGWAIGRMGTEPSQSGTFNRHGWVLEHWAVDAVRRTAEMIHTAYRDGSRDGLVGEAAARLGQTIAAFRARPWAVDSDLDENISRSLAVALVLAAAARAQRADAISVQCQEGMMEWCSCCTALAFLGQRLPIVCEAENRTGEAMITQHYLAGRPGQLADCRHVELIDDELMLSLIWWTNCGTMRVSLMDEPDKLRWRARIGPQGNREYGLVARFEAGHTNPALREVTITRPLDIGNGHEVWLAYTGELVSRDTLQSSLEALGSKAAARLEEIWKPWPEIHPPDNHPYAVTLVQHLIQPVFLASGSGEEFMAAQAFAGTQWGTGFDASNTAGIFLGNHASIVERDIVLELALTLSMTEPGTPLVLVGVAPGGETSRLPKVARQLPAAAARSGT